MPTLCGLLPQGGFPCADTSSHCLGSQTPHQATPPHGCLPCSVTPNGFRTEEKGRQWTRGRGTLLYSLLSQSTCHFCIRPLVFAISFAITKYQRTGGLSQRNLFPHSSGTGKSKIKVPENSVSGEGCLPGLQMAAFLLCPPHHLFSVQHGLGVVSLPLLIRTRITAPSLRPHITLIYSLEALSLNTVILGVRASTYELWGTQFSP